jgi:hypothetical protein
MPVTLSSMGLKTDVPFVASATTIATNYTLTTGYNYLTVGPVTINNGFTVTVNNGVVWVVT